MAIFEPINRVLKMCFWNPASIKTVSISKADLGTFEACLTTQTFSAHIAGTVKPENLPKWKIPGHDPENHSQRFKSHIAFLNINIYMIEKSFF